MQIIDIAINCISAALWNSNEMEPEMRAKLCRSTERFGLLVPLVIREVADRTFETIGGAQRLEVLRGLGHKTAPCVLVSFQQYIFRFVAADDELRLWPPTEG